MKRVFAALLTVCLLMGFVTPAYADEVEDQPVAEIEDQQNPVVVSTLDELQEAIAAAEDGDTIALQKTIGIHGETLSIDKDITICCADGFLGSRMFFVESGRVVGGTFMGEGASSIFDVSPEQAQEEIFFSDCMFNGGKNSIAIIVYGLGWNHVEITGCEFVDCKDYAVAGRASTDIIMNDCYVHNTYGEAATGAITSAGNLTLSNCVITKNNAFANAGVLSSGTLTVVNCQIQENIARSTEGAVAVDLYCSGTWSIIDDENSDAGYYDVRTGEKVKLPVIENTNVAWLVYLADREAEEYFNPAFESSDESESEDTQSKPVPAPEEPEIPTPAPETEKPTDSEPAPDPNPTPKPTEQPETPLPDDANEDTPQPPQEDDDGDDDEEEGNYTRPAHKPTEGAVKPVEVTPEPAKAMLICGDVAVDTSRSVVLLGYGDGQLHETDTLTRAQLATIIYRLLDDEMIARYGTAQSAFTDVPADAWYAPYVNTLGAIGIVNGVGGGLYAPDEAVTWAQLLSVLTRFVEPQEVDLRYIQYDGWATEAIQTAVVQGWIEDSAAFEPDAVISRGELVRFINGVLESFR